MLWRKLKSRVGTVCVWIPRRVPSPKPLLSARRCTHQPHQSSVSVNHGGANTVIGPRHRHTGPPHPSSAPDDAMCSRLSSPFGAQQPKFRRQRRALAPSSLPCSLTVLSRTSKTHRRALRQGLHNERLRRQQSSTERLTHYHPPANRNNPMLIRILVITFTATVTTATVTTATRTSTGTCRLLLQTDG